ncbi:hypothetical protein METBIDRAFT_11042 [Metschnikowia bicuspidata var. bicuspidata NRRL YB-4993]|uniref:Uncharacterized protein n=1 Tax=Metschnikowia bicuspidata var. bicuspidata NRRL YB-4993 TaxID=869754 RepID=A0A1A0HDW4_9ASCO|nr:hypothetical protein METBIDRAFT_11042 [Metschnikowia bicuspidata var. bicuspidata NRRL YB-4993]OBA22170.1 hypothetical protein METBIDRAFT_11042 [Metschnikowia bicuspidata var. bicuspidata NRRL YB-4993]
MSKRESTPVDARASRRSFRLSLSSLLLRSSSRSPERARGSSSFSWNASKTSFFLADTPSQFGREPVKAEEFADSDSSRASLFTDEETKAAESIYSLIQEYDPHRQNFRFNEEFDNSLVSHGSTEAALSDSKPANDSPSTPQEGRSADLDRADAQNARHPEAMRQALVNSEVEAVSSMHASHGRNKRPAQADPMDTYKAPAASPLQRPTRDPAIGRPLGPISLSAAEIRDAAHIDSRAPAVQRTQVVDSAEKHISLISKDTDTSLSSGELLSQLNASLYDGTRNSNTNSVSSEVALQSLTVGADLNTDTPTMLYAAHDKAPSKRGAAVHKPPKSQTPTARISSAIPVQIRDGTRLARRVSVLTQSNSPSSWKSAPALRASSDVLSDSPRGMKAAHIPGQSHLGQARNFAYRTSTSLLETAAGHRGKKAPGLMPKAAGNANRNLLGSGTPFPNPGKGPVGSAPGVPRSFKESIAGTGHGAVGGGIGGSAGGASHGFGHVPGNAEKSPIDRHSGVSEGPVQQPVSSPAPSFTRDSSDELQSLESMLHDEKAGFWNPAQHERSLSMPWSKWLMMMLCALVAVPVFFLLPLGVFDHAGISGAADWRFALEAKTTLANWRFQRRYTRVQKLASLALGIAWVVVIFAMIAVGFGVGLSGS